MKCPECGYRFTLLKLGRPKQLNDKHIRALRTKGKSLREIANACGVSHGAIQAALKRKGQK